MSTVETGKFEPYTGTALNLGASGDAVTLPAGVTLKTNTIKDAGGNTIFTSNGSGTLSSVNSSLQGNMVFISSVTASASSSIEFTSGLDSTYDEYVFYFVNIHPADNGVYFTWQASTDGGSNYNTTCMTSMFRAYHQETGASSALNYDSGSDAAQSTSYINIDGQMANANDSGTSGEIHLFGPSSTTYVKQWYSTGNVMTHHADPDKYTQISYTGGYFNTTSAVNAVSFKMQTGNIDAGTIAMYGIK